MTNDEAIAASVSGAQAEGGMSGREPDEAIVERAIKVACQDNVFYECTYPACNDVPKGCSIPKVVRSALAVIGSGAGREVIEALTKSLARTRDKLADFIREHPDPGADALAVEWEAGDVLARCALASPEKAGPIPPIGPQNCSTPSLCRYPECSCEAVSPARERLEDEHHRLLHAYTGNNFADGQIRDRIAAIDAELASGATPPVSKDFLHTEATPPAATITDVIRAYYGEDVDQNDIDPDSPEAAAIERIMALVESRNV